MRARPRRWAASTPGEAGVGITPAQAGLRLAGQRR
jgi:hypothetical protein